MALSAPKDPVVRAALETAALAHDVPYDLLRAVAWHESRDTVDAVSNVGALGLMQIMPATAAALGIDPLDPAQAADGAARMLKRLYGKYQSWARTLAAYNWGPGNVNTAMAPESWPVATQKYVSKILTDAGITESLFEVFKSRFLQPVPLPAFLGGK